VGDYASRGGAGERPEMNATATVRPGLPSLSTPRVWAGPDTHARAWALVTASLLVLDAAAVMTAFGFAYAARFKAGLPLLVTPPHTLGFYSWVALWAVPVWLGLFALYRLYDRRSLFSGFHEYSRAINACTAGMLAVVAISFLDATLPISRGWLVMTWVTSVMLVCGGRFLARRLLRWLHRRGHVLAPTVIIGANEEGRALAEQLMADPGSGIRVVGFVDPSLPPGTHVANGLSILGDLGTLDALVRGRRVREMIVATTALGRTELLDLYRGFGNDGAVELRLSSGLFEILTTGVRVREISCVPLVTPQRVRITGIDAALKTLLDYAVAAAAVLVLSPLFVILAVLIRLDSPGPALHRRRVLGVSGRPFNAFKFRTMVINADAVLDAEPPLREVFERGYKLRDDPRVTRIGRLLRRTSLDELPQLFNILRGEMSLVGPRMIAPEEAGRYGKWQLNLLTVKPGITGPWQVRGRGDIPYPERVRLSMHYIRNYTIWLDLEMLLRTIPVVVLGKGAY
jgi:exopolysaccharide biosynthesis polyprenyl glycosylphosphotransferase